MYNPGGAISVNVYKSYQTSVICFCIYIISNFSEIASVFFKKILKYPIFVNIYSNAKLSFVQFNKEIVEIVEKNRNFEQ